MPAQDSVSITRSTPTMLLKQSSIPPTHTEASLDEFLDCQSDQSSEYFEDAMDRFRTASSGSPASFFESSKSFFPEQYSYGQDSQFSIHASIQIQGQEHIQMIFITYAQTPRLLRRIKLAAVFGTPEMKPFQLQCSIYDHFETTPKTLPDDMTTALKVLLPGFSFHRAITNITIPFVRDHSGVIVPRIQELDVSRNELDTSYTREAEILRKVRALGLPVIQGSDIVIASRISTARFLVLVDSRPCMERRVSFAGAGDRGRDSLQEYWDDLEDLLSLSGCRHVLEFRGITLDEDGQHIRGYLHEFPNYKIEQALCTAAKQNRFVPWRFRERWAMELVSAVAEIHDKNLVAQVDDLLKIFIRADGSTAFPARIFPRYMAQRRYGHQAPERRTGNERLEAPTKAASFQSDIFTLGIILWGLAEHKGALYGTFCPRNGCTQSPKHACTALHANPIELPDCTSGIPLYYGRMIKKCRSFNPDERPTAKILLESFPYDVRFGAPPKGIHNVRTHYPPIHFGALCHCDECGALCSFDFYACDTCNIGFCPPCMTQSNLSCMQPGHRVVRQRLPAPTVSIMS